MSVSDQCLYERLPKALPVKRFRQSLQPTAGVSSFTENQQIEFMIPSSRMGQYLNSENTILRYRLTGSAGPKADGTASDNRTKFLDHNGSCVINRIEIYHGSNLIENITNYSVLYSALLDIQIEETNQKNGLTISYGVNSTNIGRGFQINNDSYEVAMPILSSVVGILSEKFLPVGALSSPIRIVIILNSDESALVI